MSSYLFIMWTPVYTYIPIYVNFGEECVCIIISSSRTSRGHTNRRKVNTTLDEALFFISPHHLPFAGTYIYIYTQTSLLVIFHEQKGFLSLVYVLRKINEEEIIRNNIFTTACISDSRTYWYILCFGTAVPLILARLLLLQHLGCGEFIFFVKRCISGRPS